MVDAGKKLYTLTEVAKATKISMPTLQRYKKLFQSRIPSHGEGRSQRYPEEALAVFRELKKENIGKRGRPRKNAVAAPPAEPVRTRRAKKTGRGSAATSKSGEEILTLTQVSKLTGISYPTLLRYVKTSIKEIPHRGSGRNRRFLPEAVGVFKSLRERSRRGRKSGSTSTGAAAKGSKAKRRGRPAVAAKSTSEDLGQLIARISDLEKSHKQLERLLARQQKKLEKPFRVVLQRK